MTTIGEEAHKIAVEYIEIYNKLKADEKLKSKAANLAKHDIICKQLIAEFALKELEEYIQNDTKVTA